MTDLEIADRPFAWTHFSFILATSADVLWEHSVQPGMVSMREQAQASRAGAESKSAADEAMWALERRRVFLLLAGLAMETLLKAIIVKQARHAGQSVLTVHHGEKRLSKRLTTHKLNRLADSAGVPRSDEHRQLLDRLTRYVEWAGRYPVSTKSALRQQSQESMGESEWAQIQRLGDQLAAFYKQLPGDDGLSTASEPDGPRAGVTR